MWDAMQKIKYRLNAGIPSALTEWNLRMEFREKLPFAGIHGEEMVKQISLATAINRQLGNYYSSLADSEVILNGQEKPWLDISPFVSYMLDIMEQSLVDAALSVNLQSESEQHIPNMY